ncbi:3-keto-5-aminohexanoate cleavage protein [uncultured Roseobacter sp.]|uniref:3-keto-5-aminohexanoate cleavage protein n=1 Tax=uncultured Roseobacter sp. TaxID=114847 RepID=UPI0026074C7B|nr:3-keto-5-aminohexanoate cleavage protein [uncultured Roseobacter sp.]
MAQPRPVIITCAITGAIHTPSMSSHLPGDSDSIVASAIEAAEAGAAILHLHARNDTTGQPDQSVEGFGRIVPHIAEATDAVLNLTTGGSPYMTVEERVRPAAHFAPQLASLNMGSMNMGLFPMLRRHRDLQGWERDHLEGSRDLVFRNSYKDIAYVLEACRANGTRFEFECYDTAHLYNLAHFADAGAVEPPFFVQTVFGLLGGIGAHVDDITHMRRTAERLFGGDLVWSALGAGAHQMRVAATVAAAGGHMRVGLEDSLWAGPGRLAVSNAEQVEQAKALLSGLGLRAATSAEAAEILDLAPREKSRGAA